MDNNEEKKLNYKNRSSRNFIFIILIVGILSFILGYLVNDLRSTEINAAENKQISKLNSLEEYLNENYLRDVSKEDLYTGQLKGMVDALDDPYSEYYTEEEFDQLVTSTSGKFVGIGVYITSQDGLITIISPIKGSPADQAGLLPGDVILSVDGKDVDGNKAEEASNLIKGRRGTKVELIIMRETDQGLETLKKDVVRDEIKILTVDYKQMEDQAYIGIRQFNENTYSEFMDVIEKLDPDTKGIILDLRSNPGGLLDSCVAVADELLAEGKIVYTKDKDGNIIDQYDSDSDYIDLPLVTLINGGSASASEIVAGALRDHDRTVLVGETSFGKGVVQTLNRFSNRDGIKLTVAEYFTPKGLSIDKKGIKPDVEVNLDNRASRLGPDNIKEDNQLQRARKELKKLY